MYKFSHIIKIHHIFTSPAHNYFTKTKYNVGDSPTTRHKSITLNAGKGLEGDRFEFSKYPITFFSLEVAQEVCQKLGVAFDIQLFRRNIIISGIHLNSLIGKRFMIDGVEFEGIAHCAPCTWMNAVFAKGAYSLMRGRGGLRVKVIKRGELICKESELLAQENINADPLTPLQRPKLPTNKD